MKLQRSPDSGLCVLAAFAMALDIDTRELQSVIDNEYIGAGDYQLEVFPGLPRPYCWRGYHMQQFIRYAVSRGFAVTPIELGPTVAPPLLYRRQIAPVPIYAEPDAARESWRLFEETICTSRGVLTGHLSNPQEIVRGHATAYENGVVFDPRGYSFDYTKEECEAHRLYANCVWRIDRWR